MSVLYRELRSELLRVAPEAPLSLVVDLLRESSRDLFNRSHAWRETYDITLVNGQAEYDVLDSTITGIPYTIADAAFEVEVASWKCVMYNNQEVVHRTKDKIAAVGDATTQSRFWGYTNPTGSTIRLMGTPTSVEDTQLLTVTVALKPARERSMIWSDDMVDKYKDTIVSGALARLLKIPRMPWKDLALSAHYEALFREGCDDANNQGQTASSRRVVRITGYGGI